MLPPTMASRSLTPLLLLALAWPGTVAAERVDRVLSVLGERVVTASDLALEAELAVRDPSVVPALSAGDLSSLEDQRRIRGLAGQVRVYRPSRRALDARIAALRSTFVAPGSWQAFLVQWGLGEEALAALVLNRMVVEAATLRAVGVPEAGQEQAWQARYEAWIAELREAQPPHHPEPLP